MHGVEEFDLKSPAGCEATGFPPDPGDVIKESEDVDSSLERVSGEGAT